MKKRNDKQKRKENTVQETTIAQDLVQLLLKIVILILVIFLIFTFLYGIVRINDISMKPSIKDGDLVVYYRLDHRFISLEMLQFLKRIIKQRPDCVVAVAGDTVDITKDGLTDNGAEQISQDIYFDTTRFKNGVDFPLTVKEGQVFVTWRQQTKGQ